MNEWEEVEEPKEYMPLRRYEKPTLVVNRKKTLLYFSAEVNLKPGKYKLLRKENSNGTVKVAIVKVGKMSVAPIHVPRREKAEVQIWCPGVIKELELLPGMYRLKREKIDKKDALVFEI